MSTRKSIEYAVPAVYACTCGATYEKQPKECAASAEGEEHIISKMPNRDEGKVFFIEEMPALQAFHWSMRVLLTLQNAGIVIPDQIAAGGLAGVAQLGYRGTIGALRFEDAKPIADELLACVQWKSDPINHPEVKRPLLNDAIDEPTTYFALLREAFKLHVDFSKAAALLKRTSI